MRFLKNRFFSKIVEKIPRSTFIYNGLKMTNVSQLLIFDFLRFPELKGRRRIDKILTLEELVQV